MGKLDGKVALVTGSGRNIGRATILEFAKEGANVIVNARSNEAEVSSVAEEARSLGVRALAVLADVSKPDQVKDMVDQALAEFGRIDILVNNAANRPHSPFLEMSFEEWHRVIGIILHGAFYCAKAVLPSMVSHRYGRIINISGLSGFRGSANRAHVLTAKVGLQGLTRALAVEFAPYGVRVNTIVPGAFETVRIAEQIHADALLPGVPGAATPDNLFARAGEPLEIATACVFLASEDSSFITGQTIHVNGGAYLS